MEVPNKYKAYGPTKIREYPFPLMGVPQNGWLISENPVEMDDLGVPPFMETPIWQLMVRYLRLRILEIAVVGLPGNDR